MDIPTINSSPVPNSPTSDDFVDDEGILDNIDGRMHDSLPEIQRAGSISSGNIIILDSQGDENPKGILIDLDSARDLNNDLETQGIVGTRPFMAIGVLKNECHTYRHDLESFPYVFLWTIITNHSESLPEASKLRQWSKGDWDEVAQCELRDVNQDFQEILQEFPHEFRSIKSLAETLHRTLFRPRAGVIWTGTDSSAEAVDTLYNGMLEAFSTAIVFERGVEFDRFH
ncbi:hypothetical protein HJFPF1_05215 [Paramyrothecium foliicola]|nr:hypothetical protein HJFPF1_05215 [Paramyrothecium foliicola]